MKPTTKAEMIKAVEEVSRIAISYFYNPMTDLHQQIGVLKSLAKHLPEDNPKPMWGGRSKPSP